MTADSATGGRLPGAEKKQGMALVADAIAWKMSATMSATIGAFVMRKDITIQVLPDKPQPQ
jgi:hypothetical protein